MELFSQLHTLQQNGFLSALDVQFARFIAELNTTTAEAYPTVPLTAALTSYFTTQGHVCIDLTALTEQAFPIELPPEIQPLHCPSLEAWQQALLDSTLVVTAEQALQTPAPLVLHGQRVYLYRYWQYEQQLAANIQQRLQQIDERINLSELQTGLATLFTSAAHPDWQRIAAHTAVLRQFCIISGGPGTGKTSTVVKILLLLLMQNPQLRIALAAPTGKAAARMQEAIARLKPQLNCDIKLKSLIPETAYTLHRLLGSIPDSPYFRSNADTPLLYDVVVVDEASMVDLALMAKLAQAIPLTAKWILLGDKDQLASVETGTILGDLCGMGHIDTPEPSPTATQLADSVVLLKKSYRFQQHSGIGQLAQHVQQGAAQAALQLIQQPNTDDICWQRLTDPDSWQRALVPMVLEGWHDFLHAQHPRDALQAFEQFRILCALRRGRLGVVALNRLVEQILTQQGLIDSSYQWYHRRPIMITRNDYNLKLFNGDIGIIFWNPQRSGELQAFFPTTSGELRSFWVNRLPEHETVYAMTIHKSQGSEFDRILVLLAEQWSPVLSRELIYTAITRARQHVSVWGSDTVFKAAVQQHIQRVSGLRDAFMPQT